MAPLAKLSRAMSLALRDGRVFTNPVVYPLPKISNAHKEISLQRLPSNSERWASYRAIESLSSVSTVGKTKQLTAVDSEIIIGPSLLSVWSRGTDGLYFIPFTGGYLGSFYYKLSLTERLHKYLQILVACGF